MSQRILVYGASGWVGSQIVKLLQADIYFNGLEIVECSARIEYLSQVEEEFTRHHQPPNSQVVRVINCAGKTGRPNVDWCESHKDETLQGNLIGSLNIATICNKFNIHLTYFGTGCMFQYNEKFPMPKSEYNPNKKDEYLSIKETDPITFTGSFYSKTKATVEDFLKQYSNVLILRLRMPLSDDLHPRSLVTKLITYEKVVNIPNSMSVLTDLLPIAIDMCKNSKVGIYNFTNPGYVTHNQILQKYKQYIDPNFEWKNFTEEEQSKVIVAPRSNTFLDASKLVNEYPSLLPITESIDLMFQRMKNNLNK